MDLFDSIKNDIRIARLTSSDGKNESDNLKMLKGLILGNEEMYPRIDKWFSDKVVPGIISDERVALVGYKGDSPIVSAIVKKGVDTKFCHLKIHEGFQANNLGEVFFILMTMEVRHKAKNIHFTLPNSLWAEQSEFFKSFGFQDAIKAGQQYRLFDDDELRCSAPFETVWRSVLKKLPKLRSNFTIDGRSMDDDLVMSIRPEFAERIIQGHKTVEVRRVFAKKWQGSRVSLYASAPVRALIGSATISKVIKGTPEDVWENYHIALGCRKKDFFDYTKSAREVYAIELEDIRPFIANVPVTQIGRLLDDDLRPPQSYLKLDKNDRWASAVSVANLLHGTSRTSPQII